MKTLKEYLAQAIDKKWAIPHFNISDEVTLRGLCLAAKELESPLMIGTSEGEREFIGLRQAVALVQTAQEEFEIPLFLNADHTFSVEKVKQAIDYGYRSAHIDLSKKTDGENLDGTKEIVEYAQKLGEEVSVEGEIGYLVTESSKIYDKAIVIPPESLTTAEKAKYFIEKTKVDRFAPAVGTLHGIAANTPRIDIERIKKIREAVGSKITLVLHGGSGSTDDDIKAAIAAGINCVHINTEIRIAYSAALRETLKINPDETAPYKLLKPVIAVVARKAAEKIELFGSRGKI